MKKLQVSGISLFLLFFCVNLASAVMINEVMPHNNNSFGDEWVEIYNPENASIILSNWKIGDKLSNDSISLNISAYGFILIVNSAIGCLNVSNISCIELTSIGSGLNDDEETVYLYNSSNLVDNFSWNSSIKSSGKSWQFYNGAWQVCEPTPGKENSCQQNYTNQTQQNQSQAEIYLELEYNNEIENGEKFGVEVKAYNLEEKSYDIKIYITFDNDTIISETYHDNENKWKSSKYYVEEIIEGPGNKTETLELRIDGGNEDFWGDAGIRARLRVSGESVYVAEFKDEIEVLEKAIEEEAGKTIGAGEAEEGEEITDSIIRLNKPKDIKTQSNSSVYKSKTEYIKEYAIYGFSLFCIFIIILLVVRKLK